MNMNNKNRNEIMNASLRTSVGITQDAEKNPISLKESHVLKSVPNQCDASSLTMYAYSVLEEEEKTLGNYIFSYLEEGKEKKCDKCGDTK